MVRVCDGKSLPKGDPAKTYMLRVYGGMGHEIWDVTNAANPVLLTRIMDLRDTHKNWWECDTGIAYLVSGAPGWRVKRMTQVYDLSDPTKPVHIRDFGLPGQEPGATGPVPADFHGPISTGPKGNRIYFGYGTDKGGVLQIIDREKLLNAGDADPRIRQGQGRSDPRHRDDRQRADPQRMRRNPADGVVRRRHPGEDAEHDLDLPGAGGERPLL
jgi:hypothetical protein